jgi:hypothetical protein
MLNVLSELEPRFRKSGQQRLLIELTLVRFALLDHTIALEEVLRGMGSGGGNVAASAATASVAAVPDWRAAISPPTDPAAHSPPHSPPHPRPHATHAAPRVSPLTAMRTAMEASAQDESHVRLNDDQRRAERAKLLRAKDPVLGAAIDALDLELLD